MAGIFLKIVNMSISACWIVLAIILLRILLKKAPKWINCVLWGIAGLRLVMPFSFESIFSLIPSAETITKVPDSPRPHIDSGVSVIDNQVNDYLQGNYFEGVTKPMGNFVDVTTILAIAWLVGIVALLIYTLVSFLRLKSKIGTAVLLRDNIYQSEAVVSPFVLGIIKPKIYLPFNLNEQDMNHVIAHEQAHIRRKDHLWKPLGFLILTLHWFNPLVWLGYILLCRDIELACDEKVVKELNNEQRADYSQALLTCSVNRRMIAACPIAFGEVGVKDRVKSVLNYKKPAFWIIVVAIVVSIVTAICFLTDPLKATDIQNGSYRFSKEIYFNGAYSYIPYIENNRVEIKTKGGMHIYHFIGEELSTGALYKEVSLNKENFSDLFDNIEIWSDNQNHSDLLKNNKKAWCHNTPDDIGGYPYMLLLQKDGTLYMLFADFENKEPSRVCYIYELEYTGNVENGFVHTQSLDEAISQAILDDNYLGYYGFGTECATEGHVIYGTDVDGDKYTVYALTDYANFGFMNGYFVEQSGGSGPAVMTFEKTSSGYKLLDIQYPQDGEGYVESIKELFPKKYQYRVMHPTSWDYNSIWKQKVAYAQAYLDEIGRTEEIRDYSQVEHTLFTDIGVSVEVSNKIIDYNLPYNYDVGYFESVEDGVRYIYRTTYEKKQNRIIYTKENYETEEVVEKIEIDSLTGEIITLTSLPDENV